MCPASPHCCLVWGCTPPSTLNKILILQHRALKRVWDSELEPFLQALLLQVHQICAKHLLIFMYKYKNGMLPEPFPNLFTLHQNVVPRATRANLPYYIYPPRLESTHCSLFLSWTQSLERFGTYESLIL